MNPLELSRIESTSPLLRESERGLAILELAIVSFLIFMIPLATFECASLLKAQQVSTVLSRELAGLVYRECVADEQAFPANRTDSPVSRFDPRLCISGVVENQFRAQVNNLFSGCGTDSSLCPKFAVSLFGSNASGSNAERDFYMSDDNLDPKFARFNRAVVVSDAQSGYPSALGLSLRSYGVLVVVQVRVPVAEPSSGRGWLVSFFVNRIYGVSIV